MSSSAGDQPADRLWSRRAARSCRRKSLRRPFGQAPSTARKLVGRGLEGDDGQSELGRTVGAEFQGGGSGRDRSLVSRVCARRHLQAQPVARHDRGSPWRRSRSSAVPQILHWPSVVEVMAVSEGQGAPIRGDIGQTGRTDGVAAGSRTTLGTAGRRRPPSRGRRAPRREGEHIGTLLQARLSSCPASYMTWPPTEGVGSVVV